MRLVAIPCPATHRHTSPHLSVFCRSVHTLLCTISPISGYLEPQSDREYILYSNYGPQPNRTRRILYRTSSPNAVYEQSQHCIENMRRVTPFSETIYLHLKVISTSNALHESIIRRLFTITRIPPQRCAFPRKCTRNPRVLVRDTPCAHTNTFLTAMQDAAMRW